jgi:hypothetical protein
MILTDVTQPQGLTLCQAGNYLCGFPRGRGPTQGQALAWQPELRPTISTVYGPLDYRIFRDQLLEIDRLLRAGIEAQFVREVLSHLPADADAATRNRCAKNAVLALRCNIARKLTGLACRAFAVRAAESHLLHWFPGIASLDMVKRALERHA